MKQLNATLRGKWGQKKAECDYSQQEGKQHRNHRLKVRCIEHNARLWYINNYSTVKALWICS